VNPDELAKTQYTDHPPLSFQQLTWPSGVGSALFAGPTILMNSQKLNTLPIRHCDFNVFHVSSASESQLLRCRQPLRPTNLIIFSPAEPITSVCPRPTRKNLGEYMDKPGTIE
jgi:hypothetical protein